MQAGTPTLVALGIALSFAPVKAEGKDVNAAINHPLTKAIAEHAATLATCEGVQGTGSYANMRADAEERLASILPKGTPTGQPFDVSRAAVRKSGEARPSGQACQLSIMRTTQAFNSEITKIFLANSARKVDAENARVPDEMAAWLKAERAGLEGLPPEQRTLAAGAIMYVTTWGICRWSISHQDMMRNLVILRLSTIKGHPWAVDAINRVEHEVTPYSFGGSDDQRNTTRDCENKLEATWRKLEWAQAKDRLARKVNP